MMDLIDVMCICIFTVKMFGLVATPWWLVILLMVFPTIKWLCGGK